MIENRDFLTPDDVQFVIKPVLRHRLQLFDQLDPTIADEKLDKIIESTEVK